MKLKGGLIAAALVLTSGCAPTPPTLPSAPPSVASAPASLPASTPALTSPPASGPSLPDAVGAVDVSAYDLSAFASPTGAIWCAVDKQAAWCHFPKGFRGSVPTSEEICPEEMLDVTNISVGTKVEYGCSGDPTAFPALNNAGNGLEWFAATGFPKVTYDGFTLATLPYGQKLANGSFACLSEKSGVTCANTKLGIGFKMAKAGVTILP